MAGRYISGMGGMASSLGIYAAVLLSVSRVPKAMADDGLMAKRLNILHHRYQTPYISIILCSMVVSFMILWPFAELLIIDVTVYGAGLSLEYIALIKLRIKEPEKHRPFRIPLSVPWLCVVLLLPVTVYVVALAGALSTDASIKAPIFCHNCFVKRRTWLAKDSLCKKSQVYGCSRTGDNNIYALQLKRLGLWFNRFFKCPVSPCQHRCFKNLKSKYEPRKLMPRNKKVKTAAFNPSLRWSFPLTNKRKNLTGKFIRYNEYDHSDIFIMASWVIFNLLTYHLSR
jgi:amino acid transporter